MSNHSFSMDSNLEQFLFESVAKIWSDELGLDRSHPTVPYVAEVVTRFVAMDSAQGITDSCGNPVLSVSQMIAEGDITLNANSFAREQYVHQFIGDYLLFWTGMFITGYGKLRASEDFWIDPVSQAKSSYRIAASFEHPPYNEKQPVLKELSETFELHQYGVSRLAKTLNAA
jgi:hypothetical protein